MKTCSVTLVYDQLNYSIEANRGVFHRSLHTTTVSSLVVSSMTNKRVLVAYSLFEDPIRAMWWLLCNITTTCWQTNVLGLGSVMGV